MGTVWRGQKLILANPPQGLVVRRGEMVHDFAGERNRSFVEGTGGDG